MMESSDKTWSNGEGNGKPLQHSCPKNHTNSAKRQKDTTLKHELPRSVGARYATGEEGRNCSRRNEEAESKWKECPAVDVSSGGSKVQRYKEQHYLNQGMLVHESRQIGSSQTGASKSECRHSRNQRTKMDWNG